METTAVVHMTECKPHSTVASARVARFIKDTLDITLIDTKEVARDRIASCFFPERLIIVNGPMAFCDFLEELAVFVRAAKKVVWVQQDYTIMPPAAISNAESPFRKAFADKQLRPVFWTTCKDNVRTEHDRYINWNQLTYDPKEFVAPTIGRVLYYGAFREKRLRSFTRFMKDPLYPLEISTTTLRAKKFRELGTGEVFVKPFDNVIHEAQKYAASLYIEDEKSHNAFHSPANRFYEMLSAGVPIFFDDLCTRMLKSAGIHVPDKWCVGSASDLQNKFTTYDLDSMRKEQRELWHRDYVGELTNRLLEIGND